MKITEQPRSTVRKEDWDNLAAQLVKFGYGVLMTSEKNPDNGKMRKVIRLFEPKDIVGSEDA